ncbi:uncharacterized protein C15orf39 homolog isoform X2 [Strigops habroptila]|uniref:uncharacterized protein C15orf39 homolog isoform X2 n=2 Tax=Strigops habroptila TaxID=2489341 RepID=UPI0011CFF1CC|nr:uncharacterized protein C15orf39 homolog isoform X2 [Strigops habroptila]
MGKEGQLSSPISHPAHDTGSNVQMASKRHVEPLDPVIFTKLPRLERDPAASFPRGLCKPSPGSENRFNYKGSYFAYALQSPDGPEPPRARRSPAPPYLHYGTGASSQPMLAEGPGERCPPYPPESLGPGLKRPPGAEKGKDRLVSELVMTREKWGGLGPHHPFPVKKPVAVNPLAVPKPVYRAPEYFMDSRVALPLQQRPGNADWALPTASPASHPFHPGEHRRGPHADPSLPQLHPSMALPAREKVGSPVGFSPYYTVFEQYRSPPAHPFLDTSPHSQRKAPEMSRLSPDPWHKLRPPATSPVYQERPPECYLQSHYPLPLHKAPLFYPPSAPHMEAQPSGAYRGFGFAGSREPYPGTYLKPQAPRSYFPNPSDTYMSRAASAGAVASPPPKPAALPRDAEPPRQAGYVPSSSFAFSPGGMDVSSTSRARMEPGCEQHQAEGSRQPVVVRHSSAFQPICTQEKVPGGSSGLTETFPKGKGGGSNGIPEAFPKGEAGSSCGITKTFPKGEGRWVNQDPPEQKPPNPERRAGSAPRKTPSEGPPALIAIGKGDTCKVKDAAKELISLSPPASPPELLEDPRDSEVPPPSPPMPVIKKVFSLASCGDYLEGTEGSASFCREHLWGDTPPLNMGGSQEPMAAVPTAASQELVHSGVEQSQEESGHRSVPEEPEPVPRDPGSEEDSSNEEESKVLDLSLKKRLVEPGETRRVLDGQGAKEEKKDPERTVRAGEETKPRGLPLLVKVASLDRNSFQSSASFLFTKYKILRSTPAPPSTIPPLFSTIPTPASTIPAPPSTIPAPSSIIPALSSTIPAPLSTIPALSSTIPALSITIPTQPSRTTPSPPSTISALSSTIPAPPTTISAPSSIIPALSNTIPAPSSTIPPQPSRIIPAPSSTIPAPPSTISSLSSTIPTQPSSTILSPSSTIPALSSTIPTQPSSTILSPSSTIPALSSTIPAPPSTIPALSRTIPALSITIPAQPSCTTPSLSSTIPALSSTIPAPSSTIPSPPSTIPALSSTIPSPPSTIPAPSSTIPALSSTIPSPPSTIPAPSSTIPAPPSSPPRSPAPPPAPCSSTPPASPQPGPLAPPPLPEPPCALLGEERVSLPGPCAGPAPHASAGQYFTTLHTWLCDVLSCSVARSSPELLREWLKKVEPEEEHGEAVPKSPLKAKNGSRVPEHHKATKGKEIWLAFQDVAALLANLLSQLETFMFARKCPFPHVVRAGAVFIPIHVVKEKLFPKLPGVSVDQVLQEHKVELRPTTLSEERHLRDLELKSCTSRMLKLLALKQLPDIYPDLLNLHWHNSIKQQLGSSSQAGKNPSNPGMEVLMAKR